MKKVLFPAIVAGSLAFSMALVIKTNYHDLPRDDATLLKELLVTNDLDKLSAKSRSVLTGYFENNVLNGAQNYGDTYFDQNSIKQKYFYHVYNNLPGFVDANERHAGYYAREDEPTDESQLLAYAIYRVDRSAANLNALYKYFKPMLPKLLPKAKYDSIGVSKSVNSLIVTYNHITKLKDYQDLLTTLYNTVDTMTGIHYPGLDGGRFEPFGSAYGHSIYDDYILYDKYLGISKASTPDEELYEEMWAFSFWVRRHKENNMAVVYKLLNEIKKQYE